MVKKIVINNDMIKQTKAHIVGLFKPSYNPFMDRPASQGGLDANNFALQYYPGSKSKNIVPTTTDLTNNPVGTIYNNKNIVTNLFLCTQDFIDYMIPLNQAWEADTQNRVLTKITYNTLPTSGFIVYGTPDTSALTLLKPLINGPTANKATSLDDYERFALNGLWGTNSTNNYGIGSTSIQELFLRYLYSIDQEKRDIAFEIGKVYYGMDSSMTAAANKGFIPAIDFNSGNLTVTEVDDTITLEYVNPIEFSPHYDETIHNPLNKKLYLYFPFITTNAQRPKIKGTDNNNYDGQISLFTGVTPSNFGKTSSILVGANPASNFANGSFSYVNPQGSVAPTPTYGTYVENSDMAVLTNSIWSEPNNKWVNQAGYTAIQISEVGGGGDITFDHTDKIDFIDSLKFVIKAPKVFM